MQEDDTAGFPGVDMKHNCKNGFLNMTRKCLIKQVSEALGLNVGTTNRKFTPADGKPLTKHLHGESASFSF